MKPLEYQVSFNTPAFLGNAEQQGQWRTPPFKALIRQWWRVVKARDCRYDHRAIRDLEGDLFGNAWLEPINGESRYRKSRIAVRVTNWKKGGMSSQNWLGGVGVMESVTTTRDGKGSVRADVYLGFGPVSPKRNERRLITIRRAIGTDEETNLQLLPERLDKLKPTKHDIESVCDALRLMAWFGTLGSRSRNGWGSLSLDAKAGTAALTTLPATNDALLKQIGREWTTCLELDWPHALGFSGEEPLIWLTRPFQDWRKVMGCLANIRVEVRRVAKSFSDASKIGGIHLMGYPAGEKWTLTELSKGQPRREDQEGRLATQLRFKVARSSEGLVGIVFHIPHRFPKELFYRLNRNQQGWLWDNEQKIWQAIHRALDNNNRVSRLGA